MGVNSGTRKPPAPKKKKLPSRQGPKLRGEANCEPPNSGVASYIDNRPFLDTGQSCLQVQASTEPDSAPFLDTCAGIGVALSNA